MLWGMVEGGCCPVVSAAVGEGGTWDFQSFLLDFITAFLYIFIFADSRPPTISSSCARKMVLLLFSLSSYPNSAVTCILLPFIPFPTQDLFSYNDPFYSFTAYILFIPIHKYKN